MSDIGSVTDQGFPPALSARGLTVNALFAALLAASGVLMVPIGTVPLTLQVLIVVLIALIVPPSWAAVSVGTYLIAGGIGMPIFSGLRGGLGVLLGPTGGYLFGFLLGAVSGAFVRRLLAPRVSRLVADSAAAATVIVVVYLVGWLQLSLVTGMGLLGAFAAGVMPFIAPDAAKAVVAVLVAPLVRSAARL